MGFDLIPGIPPGYVTDNSFYILFSRLQQALQKWSVQEVAVVVQGIGCGIYKDRFNIEQIMLEW